MAFSTRLLYLLFLGLPLLSMGQSTGKHELTLSFNTIDPPPRFTASSFDPSNLSNGANTVKGYSIGLAGKYFANENLAWRMQAIFTNRNTQQNSDYSSGSFKNSYSGQFYQPIIKLYPSIQWGFSQRKVSFHGGIGTPVSVIGKLKFESITSYKNPNGVQTAESQLKYSTPGGFSVGIGTYAGTEYFITNSLKIGFEFGIAYQYTTFDSEIMLYTKTVDANSSGVFTSSQKVSAKIYELSPVNGALTLAYRF